MCSTSEHVKSKPRFPTIQLGPNQKGPVLYSDRFLSSASQDLLYSLHCLICPPVLAHFVYSTCLLWDNCRLKGKWANIANYAWIFSESYLNYKYLDRPNDIFVNTGWDHYICLNMVCLQPMVHVGLIIPCSNIHSWSCLCVFEKTYFEYVLPKINNNTKDAISGKNTNLAPKM